MSTELEPRKGVTTLSALADALSTEERKFCEALACHPGITAKEAGIRAGWSEKSAHVTASRALDRPGVQAYLEGLKEVITGAVYAPGEKRIKRKVMKAREVLWRMSRIGRASIRPHLKLNGNGQVIGTEIDPEHADTIRGLKTRTIPGVEDGPALLETEIKVADPLPALMALQKYHGLEKAQPQAHVTNNNLTILGESEGGLELLRKFRELLLAQEQAKLKGE